MNDEDRAQAKERFLVAYAAAGNILLSCKAASIARSTFYEWQEKDEEFSLKWHQAERDFADLVLAEFIKRAKDGYEKPVVSAGRIVYEEIPELDKYGFPVVDEGGHPVVNRKPLMERVVSDTLLAMAVKKHFPEYRDKQQVDLTSNGASVVVYLPDNGRDPAVKEGQSE
jgi:hypothetical protein